MGDIRITAQVLRVLAAMLAISPAYGGVLMKETGLASGSLYPILDRLERGGLIVGTWEDLDPAEAGRPRRREYVLTPPGRATAEAEVRAMQKQLRFRLAWGI
jgi:PadR family transcriptional regulator PadR